MNDPRPLFLCEFVCICLFICIFFSLSSSKCGCVCVSVQVSALCVFLCEVKVCARQKYGINTYPWLFLYPHAINYCPEQQPWDRLLRMFHHKNTSVHMQKPANCGTVVLHSTQRPCFAIHFQWQSLSRETSGLQLYSRGDVNVHSPTVIHIHFLNWFN